MLSAQKATIDDIRYPCWVSTKFDGIRNLARNGQAVSRNNIPHPNLFLQSKFSSLPTILAGLDGELIIGDPTAEDCYSKTDSGISSIQGEPPFQFYVFDDFTDPGLPFEERQKRLAARFMSTAIPDWCVLVKQWYIETRAQLESLYSWLVEQGHEGVITRNGLSPYKQGRGTIKAQDMIKLKPRHDSEFVVVGIEELERNHNVATVGERGQTKRSSAKAGKVAGGTLGKLVVRDIHTKKEFRIGSFKGLKDKDKQYIFDHQDEFMGRYGVYTSCSVGVKDLPRHPVWKSWISREEAMSKVDTSA